jgi:hypothetical protein
MIWREISSDEDLQRQVRRTREINRRHGFLSLLPWLYYQRFNMSNDQSNSNDESANENLNPFFNIEDNEPGNGHITDDESAEMVNPTFSLSTDDLPAVNYCCPLIRHIHVPHSRPRRLHPPHLSHRRSYDETFRSCLIRALNLIVTMAGRTSSTCGEQF